jgi:predicted nucleotide-binding protein
MDSITLPLAKLGAILKIVQPLIQDVRARYLDPEVVVQYFESANRQFDSLRLARPDLFGDLPAREVPKSSGTTDFSGRGYIERGPVQQLMRDIEYVFEVRASSEPRVDAAKRREQRVFISHGRSNDWREVQAFLDKDVGVGTLELAQEPNRGRTVLQKLVEEANRCTYAVVVMTGDDVGPNGEARARENVMHEIGFFQGTYGLQNVTLLHEEGTNIPSNIHGLVYIPYPKGTISAALATLARELRAAGLTS